MPLGPLLYFEPLPPMLARLSLAVDDFVLPPPGRDDLCAGAGDGTDVMERLAGSLCRFGSCFGRRWCFRFSTVR